MKIAGIFRRDPKRRKYGNGNVAKKRGGGWKREKHSHINGFTQGLLIAVIVAVPRNQSIQDTPSSIVSVA